MKCLRVNHLAALSLVVFWTGHAVAQINPISVTNLPGYFNQMVVSGAFLYAANRGTAPNSGLRIFNISNPVNPLDVGFNDGQGGAQSVAVSERYAYVVYGAKVGIFDVSNPTNPVSAGQITGAWSTVNVLGRYAFLTGGFAVDIYDISNPSNPISVGTINGSFYPPAVLENYAYMLGAGFFVYDISTPSKPVTAGPISYYWGDDIAISGDYAYVVAATNTFWIFNISNRTNPLEVFSSGWQPLAVKVQVWGNYAFLLCQLGNEIRLYDVSNPTNAAPVSSISPNYGLVCFTVSGNYAYICNGTQLSIFSLGITPPNLLIEQSANLLLSWPTPAGAFAVQQNPDLNPAHWTTLTNTSVVVGSNNQVRMPKPQQSLFYRLISQ